MVDGFSSSIEDLWETGTALQVAPGEGFSPKVPNHCHAGVAPGH